MLKKFINNNVFWIGMKKGYLYFCVFLFILLLVGLVDSIELKKTPITLNAKPRMNFTMRLEEPNGAEGGRVLEEKADGAGFYVYNYYSPFSNFLVKLEFEYMGREYDEEYGPYDAGSSVSINLLKVIDEEVLTDTGSGPNSEIDPADADSLDTGADDENKITGLSVGDSSSELSRKIYFIAGGFILAGAFVFFFLRVKNSKRTLSNKGEISDSERIRSVVIGDSVSKVPERKFAPLVPENNQSGAVKNPEKLNELVDAEKRIADLQREISLLKNRNRIREIERHIKREQRELERLQRDTDFDSINK